MSTWRGWSVAEAEAGLPAGGGVEAIASAGSGIGVSRFADVRIVHRQMAAATEVEGAPLLAVRGSRR